MDFAQEGYANGVLIVEGNRVRVYKPGARLFRHIVLPVEATSAMWTGTSVQVTLANGFTRVYTSFTAFRHYPPAVPRR